MFERITEYHRLAKTQIKQSMSQLETQINIMNQDKAQRLLKQQRRDTLHTQFKPNELSIESLPPTSNGTINGTSTRNTVNNNSNEKIESAGTNTSGVTSNNKISNSMTAVTSVKPKSQSPAVDTMQFPTNHLPFTISGDNRTSSTFSTLTTSTNTTATNTTTTDTTAIATNLDSNRKQSQKGPSGPMKPPEFSANPISTSIGGSNGLNLDISHLFSQYLPGQLDRFNLQNLASYRDAVLSAFDATDDIFKPKEVGYPPIIATAATATIAADLKKKSISPRESLPATISNNFKIDLRKLDGFQLPAVPRSPAKAQSKDTDSTEQNTLNMDSKKYNGVVRKERIKKQQSNSNGRTSNGHTPIHHTPRQHQSMSEEKAVGKKPAYTAGELEMMRNHDRTKCNVEGIIDVQKRMQQRFGHNRTAYEIAQKMYRMGVIKAMMPKKIEVFH